MAGPLTIYALAVNIGALCLFYSDKRRAKMGKFRIPEAALMLLPIFGGALGGVMGMLMFRHKTRHRLFNVCLPLLLILDLAVILLIFKSLSGV